ncbi:uncharacterized protein LOC113874303 [Abrus precatorius]|uniref:Uncharacterized protein LOC113874303 n=1 Tax=Abrus precatorius TaxID=3816 RepID=A0A8B8MM79_ABRPR|nr:uncharacterized protein LOC113874303 [Abrus precatorius]
MTEIVVILYWNGRVYEGNEVDSRSENYTILDVCDDEDIDCMISACEERHERVVELYVDIAVGETSHVGENDEDEYDDDYEDEGEIPLDSSSDTDLEDDFDSMMTIPNTERNNIMQGQSAGMVKEEPSVPVSLIQEGISGQFGYSVSYKKAWKAKQKAIVTIFGDWDESYATLPRWLEYMQLHAPGSVYKIETNDYVRGNVMDNRFRVFHRVFWSFRQCREAFKFCKPIIQVDGTFLYGKYKQTLLIGTTQDGNNSVLPITFAIVEGETLSAWEWFLAMIRLNVTDKTGICLISDRHQSIKSAVSNPHIGWQPPNAYHVYYIRHIASNFNRRFKNSAMKSMLMKLAYTPCKQRFEAGLNKFRSYSPEVQTWIDNISKEKWSLAYDHEGRRYDHMTTNLSESVNKVLKGARNLPITALVKATYSRLVEYFVKRGESAINDMNNGKRYCRKLIEAIEKNQEEASSHQAYRYPCSHVIAACVTVSIDFWQYVDPVYTLQYVVNAYSSQWWPLGNEANILQNDEWKLLPDQDRARGKGRLKACRIRNEMDWVESQPRQRCRLCRQPGHNQRHCTQQSNANINHD